MRGALNFNLKIRFSHIVVVCVAAKVKKRKTPEGIIARTSKNISNMSRSRLRVSQFHFQPDGLVCYKRQPVGIQSLMSSLGCHPDIFMRFLPEFLFRGCFRRSRKDEVTERRLRRFSSRIVRNVSLVRSKALRSCPEWTLFLHRYVGQSSAKSPATVLVSIMDNLNFARHRALHSINFSRSVSVTSGGRLINRPAASSRMLGYREINQKLTIHGCMICHSSTRKPKETEGKPSQEPTSEQTFLDHSQGRKSRLMDPSGSKKRRQTGSLAPSGSRTNTRTETFAEIGA